MADTDQALARRVAAGLADKELTALTTAPSAAPAGGSGATGGAYDTAGNRDAMIVTVNDTRTRVGEIETALQKLGLIK